MVKDYEIEDGKCVVCGDESNNLPLCKSCYNSYKRFFNDNCFSFKFLLALI